MQDLSCSTANVQHTLWPQVSLDWLETPSMGDTVPICVLVPGLTGSSGSAYIRRTACALRASQMRVACFNPRGRLSWAANANAGGKASFRVHVWACICTDTSSLSKSGNTKYHLQCPRRGGNPVGTPFLYSRRPGGFWSPVLVQVRVAPCEIQHDASQRASLDCFLVRLIVHLTRRRRDRFSFPSSVV